MLLANDKTDVDLQGHYGSTPLSIVARHGYYTEACELLLDTRRANIDSRDYFGRTPLWYAKRYGHPNVAKLLCETMQKTTAYHFMGAIYLWR